MDPAEERRDTKRHQEYINMLGNVCDSEYGIPRRCPCGGRMIDEVRVKEEHETHPGKRFFTCINYEADGLHYRQPWVVGVQEEIEHLRKRVDEAEEVIKWVPNIKRQIESVEVSVFIFLSVPNSSPGSSRVPKPVERKKWTPQEDIVLISAWLNTSKDPIVSNQQKLVSFWRRIEEYFNSSPLLTGSSGREWSTCKQRWGRLNSEVCKFVGSYEAALKEQASGQNENDVMKAAHNIFFNDYTGKFTLEHAWRELRFDQKWRSTYLTTDGAKEKRKEATETVPDSEEEVRPPGVKACKAAAKRKKHGNEAAYDRLQTILDMKQNISKQKLLDRLLSKKDTLTDSEVSLKDKLVAEML
ncbi:hypothetical protein YC2023_036637 [Brassica napus]